MMKTDVNHNRIDIMKVRNSVRIMFLYGSMEVYASQFFQHGRNVVLLFFAIFLIASGCDEPTPMNPSIEEVTGTVFNDVTLAADERWKPDKTYIVHGTLEIPPGVTLEILPGTIVKFGRDAFVKVRGILKAGSTLDAAVDEPVIFTSENTGPQPSDWQGILFEHTHEHDSFLRGVSVTYATVGVDIKTTSPTVSDCTFHLNHTAVALDGSDAEIVHNEFFDNNIGIRTIGRQTRPRIERNTFRRNDIGIFCENVQSIIQYNNLSGNIHSLKLNVKFDVYAPNNWWGSLADEEIDAVILDAEDPGMFNKQVGKIYYQPIADVRIADAGTRE